MPALADFAYAPRAPQRHIHDTPARMAELRAALEGCDGHFFEGPARELGAEILAGFASWDGELDQPERICHGDLKISNLRFDEDGVEGVCLLDFDTLAPMALQVEMGDAWRSWCNPAGESDPEAVRFDLGIFEASARAWLAAFPAITAARAGVARRRHRKDLLGARLPLLRRRGQQQLFRRKPRQMAAAGRAQPGARPRPAQPGDGRAPGARRLRKSPALSFLGDIPMLKAGESFPSFSLPDQDGKSRSLGDLAGDAGLVLYVYPKDDTPGCTLEAQDFRNQLAAFRAKGWEVAGLSEDSAESHCQFIEKYELTFPLLSDVSGEFLNADRQLRREEPVRQDRRPASSARPS